MTANKHTPGPWHMDPEEVTGGFRIVPKIGDRGLAVAIQRDAAPAIPGSGIDRATAEANARLIAAAPDLREALQGLLDDVIGLMRESEGVAGLHLNGDVADWASLDEGGRFERLSNMSAARAAIAQATGGAA